MKRVLAWAHTFIHSSVSFSLKRAGEEVGDMNECSMQSSTYYIKEAVYLQETVPERKQDILDVLPGTDTSSQNRQYFCQTIVKK